jgi:hypothetical protein
MPDDIMNRFTEAGLFTTMRPTSAVLHHTGGLRDALQGRFPIGPTARSAQAVVNMGPSGHDQPHNGCQTQPPFRHLSIFQTLGSDIFRAAEAKP